MSSTATYSPFARRWALVLAIISGVATIGGFAPLYLSPLPLLTLAILLVIWQQAPNPRRAALIGFCFGIGYFLTGVSWVYVSLHDFGGMPPLLAGVLTLIFCFYLALFPAIVGWIYVKLGATRPIVTFGALPALWTLAEWLRGWLFTGFPWIAMGYTQVPASPLAGYLPLFGVYSASLLTILCAALIATLCIRARSVLKLGGTRSYAGLILHPSLLFLVLIYVTGYFLLRIEWTQPAGKPISVSLLQGNISQEMKWRDDKIVSTLETYRKLVISSDAPLIILPETALPLFLHEIPSDYLDALAAHARNNQGDILIGVPERGTAHEYYNSVLSFGASPTQTYRKTHLVPFGEFVPLKPLFGWFLEVAQIPLLDFSRGSSTPQPLAVADLRIAVDICYEDAFGAEIIRQLPQATLLVNVSNVAWFGRSIAPEQHLQISQARALETGRFMLRATNTGVTAIIDQHGAVQKAAPQFTTTIISGNVQGYAGATPYVRWGNAPIIALAAALLISTGWIARRGHGKLRASTKH